MKLNNFFDKEPSIRKEVPKFTLTNGRLEEDLKQERLKTNELEQFEIGVSSKIVFCNRCQGYHVRQFQKVLSIPP